MPSTANDVFKNLFVAHDLELKTLETLKIWMPTYLQEIERQSGLTRGLIPRPRTYTTRNEFTTFPEDQMPICVVISPGIVDRPEAEGNGTYSGWFSLGVGLLCSAKTEEDTNHLSKIYAAAIRGIMLQQSDLGGIASAIEWMDESYDDIPIENQERTIRASQWVGMVLIDDIVTRFTGPLEPDPENAPGSLWPNITSGSIILKKEFSVGASRLLPFQVD